MDGYFVTGQEKSKGTLRVRVTNLEEFKRLTERAKNEAHQLAKTINELECFELDVDVRAE